MRPWLIIAAIALVVGFGVLEGLWSNRWRVSGQLEAAAARIEAFPADVDDWRGQVHKLERWQIEKGEVAGYRMQQFVHDSSGTNLTVLLLCGRPGPMSVHTPDICYAGAGFTQVGAAQKRSITMAPSAAAEFWVATFHKGGPNPEHIEIYWAWSADGVWSVPLEPRFTFAHASALHKLYVIRPVGSVEESKQDDVTPRFLKSFLPVLQNHLFAP